jgi:hypothetical protein
MKSFIIKVIRSSYNRESRDTILIGLSVVIVIILLHYLTA